MHDLVEPSRAPALHLVLPDEHHVVGDVDASRTRRREHEPLARADATTQDNLARVAVPPVADEVGEQRMRHEALVDVDEIVAAVGAERRPGPPALPSAQSLR